MRAVSGRTVLVTGATSGLGRHLAGALAARGARVILHGRDSGRLQATREAVDSGASDVGGAADTVLADLADLRQADRLARQIRHRHERLDTVVNNAGIGAGPPGSGREESRDGIELRFAVNYLAGYLLTRLLTPVLAPSPDRPARVVNVASGAQEAIDFDDSMLTSGYDGWRAYAQSKLAQVMFTFDLAEELRNRHVAVTALHPATFMNTTMVREAGVTSTSTVEHGGAATLRLITTPDQDRITGRYFNRTRPARAHPQAYDADARARLRELSDTLIATTLGSPEEPSIPGYPRSNQRRSTLAGAERAPQRPASPAISRSEETTTTARPCDSARTNRRITASAL